jgi:hypothetical protein
MGKKLLQGIILVLGMLCTAYAQTDSTVNPAAGQQLDPPVVRRPYRVLDSAALARWKARKDSIRHIADSLTRLVLKAPPQNKKNLFLDSLIEHYRVRDMDFSAWAKRFPKKTNHYSVGAQRAKGETWIPAFIMFLLLFFAILKNTFSKELETIIQSFYSNRILVQINKEDTLFSSWPFIFLYVLFGFTIGMFLYLCGKYYQLTYDYSGFQWFFILSLIVLGLFTFKIVLLRLFGFLFDVQRMVREYVSVLYLSYFNTAIIFLPLVLAFSLTPARYSQIYIYLAIAILCVIFFFQFIRGGANILSNYQFPKTYLFLYLCALEICPLLILIKVLKL